MSSPVNPSIISAVIIRALCLSLSVLVIISACHYPTLLRHYPTLGIAINRPPLPLFSALKLGQSVCFENRRGGINLAKLLLNQPPWQLSCLNGALVDFQQKSLKLPPHYSHHKQP